MKFLMILFSAFIAQAAPQPAQEKAEVPNGAESAEKKIKYKSAKDVSFEELLIQGQLRRPEITVVTGEADEGTNGLLRLRESFLDKTAADIGEESK